MTDIYFDTLHADTEYLQGMLREKKLTSAQIVQKYFSQINRYDPIINSLISVAPQDVVLHVAKTLDEEREAGKVRSSLHGIPIVLKDNFITASDLGMGTTAGSWALDGAKASKNSAIAQKLIDAGLIILGKTNMTEWAGMKMTMMMPGWSARGGQTLSPYVKTIAEEEKLLGHSAPGGSSTGSAAAVASGFSPIAMGTETIGSIITPASRAALYALKPTAGTQDTTGLYTMTDFYDSPGPMGKSSADVLALTEILLGRKIRLNSPKTWEGLCVAFLDPRLWQLPKEICDQHAGTAEQMIADYEAAVTRIKRHGCSIKYPVDLPDASALTVDDEPAIMPIAYWEFKNVCISKFLGAFDSTPVHNLEDIIEFNERHRDKCLPPPYTEQNDLLKAFQANDTAKHITKLKQGLRAVAKQILSRIFSCSEGVNIIGAPADSSLCIYAAASGYPIATVPLGQLTYNGRPFGLCLIAEENNEDSLLQFMAAFESSSPPRAVPDLLG